jgi:hypothetical protein
MMRTLRLLVFLLIIAPSTGVYAQGLYANSSRFRHEGQKPARADLQLRTSILEEQYCDGVQLRMKLRLQYLNAGARPLILLRYGGAIIRTTVNADTKAAGHPLQEWDLMPGIYGDFKLSDEPTPGSLYVILKPGESFEAEDSVFMFVGSDSKSKNKYLGASRYVLRVAVSTWPESSDLAKRLREKWKDIGTLWTWDVTSSPMDFEVQEVTAPQPCRQTR